MSDHQQDRRGESATDQPAIDGDRNLTGKAFDDSETASLLEAATALWRDLGDLNAARKYFEQVRALDPAHPDVIEFYSELAEEEGGTDELLCVLEQARRVVREPQREIEIALATARLVADISDDADRQLVSWKAVLRLDPTDPTARAAVKVLYERCGNWRALISLLQREVQSFPAEAVADQVSTWWRVLEICRDQLGEVGGAVRAGRRILELDPAHVDALKALEQLFEVDGRWWCLAKVVETRAALIDDPADKVSLLFEVTELALKRLGDLRMAASVLDQILRIDSSNKQAIDGLIEIQRRRRAWQPLLETFDLRISRLEGDARIAALAEAGLLAERYATDLPRARACWQEVLALDSDHAEASIALSRIYEELGEWTELCEILEARLARAPDETARVALLVELGTVRYQRLNDETRAAEIFERVLASRPRHREARRQLTALYVATERWQALTDLYGRLDDYVSLSRVLAEALQGVEDPTTELALSLRCADVLATQLGRADRAVSHYERALAIDPGNQQAARALAPTYLLRRNWERLIGVLEAMPDDVNVVEFLPRRAEALLSMERSALLGRKWSAMVKVLKHRRDDPAFAAQWQDLTKQIGVILEDKLSSKRKALEAYGELLERNPGDQDYISALAHHLDDDEHAATAARILEPHVAAVEDWPLLARALEILAVAADEPHDRAALLIRLADLKSEKLGDARGAFDALLAVLPSQPADQDLWDRLTQLAEALENLEDLVDQFGEVLWSGALDQHARVELARRLATLHDSKLGLPDRAEVYHWQVLRAGADHDRASFQALERLYYNSRRGGDLLDLYAVAVQERAMDAERFELKRKACRIADEVGDAQRAIVAYRSLIEDEPGNAAVVERLIQLYEQTAGWQPLYGLLEAQLETADPLEAPALRCRLADVAARGLNRPDLALEWCAVVLEADPQYEPAREIVERLLERTDVSGRAARLLGQVFQRLGDVQEQARMLELELADSSVTAEERVRLLIELAELREVGLNDPSGAVEALFQAFATDPSKRDLRVGLARLAAALGLGARYYKALGQALAQAAGDRGLMAELLLEVAAVAQDQLGRPDLAEAALLKIVGSVPRAPVAALPALRALRRVYSAQSSWPQLLELLERLVELETDADRKRDTLLEMAEVAQSGLGDLARAAACLRALYDQDNSDPKVLGALERLYEKQESWAELIDVLRQRSALEKDPAERRAMFLRMSELARKMKSRRRP